MKLGSKKTKQAELLDALGSEPLLSEEMSAPPTPAPVQTTTPSIAQKDARGSLPSVTPEVVHVLIKETLQLTLDREGGVESMELKGDMNLNITDSSLTKGVAV